MKLNLGYTFIILKSRVAPVPAVALPRPFFAVAVIQVLHQLIAQHRNRHDLPDFIEISGPERPVDLMKPRDVLGLQDVA